MPLPVSPPPGGSPPLRYTATCEDRTCRPREAIPFDDEGRRDRWAHQHTLNTAHEVTRGTLRGKVAVA